MNRKALFFDVDGTLLSEITRKIPESALLALAEARRNGDLVFINSGRTYSFLEEIKKMVPVDGFLCGCGTYVVAQEQVLYSYEIPRERGLQIKKDIVAYGLDGILEGREHCYFRKEPSRFSCIETIRLSEINGNHLCPYTWEDDCYDYSKFCVCADEESDKDGFFQKLEPHIYVMDRGNHFYECVPSGHSKATAIQIILDHYGIELEDTYVFGDSTNDLSMFQYAKNTVLMGHHSKELEPYASFVTKTVEEDGVAYAMKALGII